MTTNVLEFLLVGREQVSEAMEKVEGKLESVHGKMNTLKVAGGLALAGAAAAAADFGTKSVEAYEEAQKSQVLLQEAYKKFPSLADVSIEKLQELNDKVQEKTGYDHNELATADAKLAMYNLTGKQIEQLTPLIADYAAKQNIDVVTAAEKVGKAMMGQTRALKSIGVAIPSVTASQHQLVAAHNAVTASTDLLAAKQKALSDLELVDSQKKKLSIGQQIQLANAHDAVTKAQEKLAAQQQKLTATQQGLSASGSIVDQVMSGLKAKVGGTADAMGETAAGKAKILAAGFKDIQEKVGAGLVPVLTKLVDIGVKVVDWINKTPGGMQILATVLGVLAAAVAVYTIAQIAMNTALWTSPITWIIAGIVALIAVVVLLVANWDTVVKFLTNIWNGFINWVVSVLNGFTGWWNGLWAAVGKFISDVWNNMILGIRVLWDGFWGWITGAIGGFGSWISDTWNGIWQGALGVVKDVWNGIADWIAGGINNVIHIINGISGAVNSVGGAVGIHIGTIPDVSLPHMATGGYLSRGGDVIVGENGAERVRLPAGSQVFPHNSSAGAGLHIEHFHAGGQSPAEIGQELAWYGRWAT